MDHIGPPMEGVTRSGMPHHEVVTKALVPFTPTIVGKYESNICREKNWHFKLDFLNWNPTMTFFLCCEILHCCETFGNNLLQIQ